MSELGKRLRALRTKRNLNAEEVARRLKVAPSTYREWENGRAIKGDRAYVALAEVFAIPLSELFGLADERVQKIYSEIQLAEEALARVKVLL